MRIGGISAVLALCILPVGAVLSDQLPWIKPADNPLLGGWQLTEETDLMHAGGGHCASGMNFEPTKQTVFQGTAPSVGDARYFWNKSGLIVVQGENASVESGLLSYRMVDHDHMERSDYLLCKYQRGDASQAFTPPPPGCPSPEVLAQMQHPPASTPMTYDQAMLIIRCEK